jgi:hypothetical protein
MAGATCPLQRHQMTRTFITLLLLASATGLASASEEVCTALTDTALFADAGLSQEIRPIFQTDGAQLAPISKDGGVMFGIAYDVLMQPMLEEPSFTRAADWTCETYAGLNSDETDRSYDVSIDACRLDMSDTRITLGPTTIGFYESACDIVDQTPGENDSVLVSLQCYGEGNEWPAQGKIISSKTDDLTIEIEGFAQSYTLCPAE